MADIFISYNRKNHHWVKRLSDALETVGYSVWWDTRLLAGEDFQDKIPEELAEAQCVIVVWSKHSTTRKWVRAEASEADDQGKLVPIRLDPTSLPLPFNMLHTQDMQKWKHNIDCPLFQHLLQSIKQHCPYPSGNNSPPQPEPPQPKNFGKWLALSVSILALIGAAVFFDPGRIALLLQKAQLEKELVQIEDWLEGNEESHWLKATQRLPSLAKSGSSEANYILAGLYYVGAKGVEKNTNEGCKHYNLAAQAGHEQAKSTYAKLPC